MKIIIINRFHQKKVHLIFIKWVGSIKTEEYYLNNLLNQNLSYKLKLVYQIILKKQ